MLNTVADKRAVCLVKVDDDLGVVALSVDVIVDLIPIPGVDELISSVDCNGAFYVRPASFGPGNFAKG